MRILDGGGYVAFILAHIGYERITGNVGENLSLMFNKLQENVGIIITIPGPELALDASLAMGTTKSFMNLADNV